MKRGSGILAVFAVVFCMLFSLWKETAVPVRAADGTFQKVTLSLNSNASDGASIDLYLRDSVHYIAIDDLCALARCTRSVDGGLISAAPSMVSPLSTEPVDVPVGIIIPQYDGDVTSLDGGTLFDQLEQTQQRSSGTDLIYLTGGNPGGFSTALVRPDPFSDPETLPLVMEPKEQQAFFSAYVQEFIKTVLEQGETPLQSATAMQEEYAGYPVVMRTDAAGAVLYRAAEDSAGW